MCLVMELMMMFYGTYALIAGWVTMGNYWTRGAPARIAGAFMVAPFPLSLTFALVMGVSLGVAGQPIREGHVTAVGVMEMLLVLVCYAVAFIIVQTNHDAYSDQGYKRKKRRPRFDDEDDDEEELDPQAERDRRDREEREARRRRKKIERERRLGVERLEEADDPPPRRRDEDDDRPRRPRDDDDDDRPRRRP
jgi:hypothetical protein